MKEQLETIQSIIDYLEQKKIDSKELEFYDNLLVNLNKLKDDRLELVKEHNDGFKNFMGY